MPQEPDTMESVEDEPEEEESEEPRYERQNLENPLFMYLQEVLRFPRLSPEEVTELAIRIREDQDINARNTLVARFTPLVIGTAKKYARRGRMELSDLVQEGNIGLIHAAELFDHRKGFHFITYAQWWIRQAILRAIYNSSRTIRRPVHFGEACGRLYTLMARLEARYGRKPELEEIAKEALLSPEQVQKILDRGRVKTVSLDDLVREWQQKRRQQLDASRWLTDHKPNPEKIVSVREAFERLFRSFDELPQTPTSERDKEIFKMRYGLDGGMDTTTLRVTADRFSLSKERIRQVVDDVRQRITSIYQSPTFKPRARKNQLPTNLRTPPATATPPQHPLATLPAMQCRTERRTSLKRKFKYLGAIARSVGGKALEEFNELLSLASRTTTGDVVTVKDLRRSFREFLKNLGCHSVPVSRKKGYRRRRAATREVPAADDVKRKVETVEVQVSLLQAAASGNGPAKHAYEAAARKLGLSPKTGCRTVAMLFARTQGKFRRHFVKRADTLAAISPGELAKLYSAIEGKSVSADELRKEAGIE